MLLMIDNYDSFTYNLVHYFQRLHQEVVVARHDQISLVDIKRLNPDHIVISPGPKSPNEAGISLEVIHEFHAIKPLLGICLGHQCLAQALGGSITPAATVIHGKTSLIHHQHEGLFHNLPSPFRATRYHSLRVDAQTLPSCFRVDAQAEDGTIMAISHRHLPLFGLQFHPEAILSEHGLQLLSNFLTYEHKTTT